jgi:hypothetical protein
MCSMEAMRILKEIIKSLYGLHLYIFFGHRGHICVSTLVLVFVIYSMRKFPGCASLMPHLLTYQTDAPFVNVPDTSQRRHVYEYYSSENFLSIQQNIKIKIICISINFSGSSISGSNSNSSSIVTKFHLRVPSMFAQ